MASRFASYLSTSLDTAAALREATRHVRSQLDGPAEIALLFASADHADRLASELGELCDGLGTDCLIGCTGESIVGNDREVEGSPALVLWAGQLPGVDVSPMHLNFARTSDGGVIEGWPDATCGEWPANSALLLVGDPYTFPADVLLERLNEDRPGVRVVGGMASSASQPGENRLVLGREVLDAGAAALLLRGEVRLRTVVSQGCRPIGQPMVVTKAERNVIFELGGRPALAVLREIFESLPTREQQLVQRGLHVGRVVSEYRESFGPGDFLIRNVVAVDGRQGAIAIGDYVRAGQTVQFHLRDHETADADLQQLLAELEKTPDFDPLGAVLFTCNGRGSRLFPEPHHDARCIRQALGELPVAGFFAAGELGPIGRDNFMHGFTASIAVFH